jgi:hypothetical protein
MGLSARDLLRGSFCKGYSCSVCNVLTQGCLGEYVAVATDRPSMMVADPHYLLVFAANCTWPGRMNGHHLYPYMLSIL